MFSRGEGLKNLHMAEQEEGIQGPRGSPSAPQLVPRKGFLEKEEGEKNAVLIKGFSSNR